MGELSHDAKSTAAALFGMSPKLQLRFDGIGGQPTARLQAALNELLRAGWITVNREIIPVCRVEYICLKRQEYYALFRQAIAGNLRIADIVITEDVEH